MKLTYEIYEDGYLIKNAGQPWIGQGPHYGAYYPYPVQNEDESINIEESCKAHIQAILGEESNKSTEEDRIAKLEEENKTLKGAIEELVQYLSDMTEGGE